VDWGVVGFAIVLSAWVCLFVGVAKTWAFIRGGVSTLGDRKGDKFAFVLGASCGLVAILVHSFFDFNMHIPANAMLVVALMALLSGHLRSATEKYWFAGGWPLKALMSLCLGGALAGMGHWGWQRAAEYAWLARAQEEIRTHPSGAVETWRRQRVEALEKAFATEPNNAETAYEVGVAYQVRSEQGDLETYEAHARNAISWFEKAIRLNPYHAYAHARLGLCLDILDEFEKAEPYVLRAQELDPNGSTTCTLVGLHYLRRADFQRSGYAIALPWFVRSMQLRLLREENLPAYQYVLICENRLAAAARRLELIVPAP